MPKTKKRLPVAKKQGGSFCKVCKKKKLQRRNSFTILGIVTIVRRKRNTWVGVDNRFLLFATDKMVDLIFFTSLIFHS